MPGKCVCCVCVVMVWCGVVSVKMYVGKYFTEEGEFDEVSSAVLIWLALQRYVFIYMSTPMGSGWSVAYNPSPYPLHIPLLIV